MALKKRYYHWLQNGRFNLFLVFICLYIAGSCYWILTQDILEVDGFTSRSSCPACLGEGFCRTLRSGTVYVSSIYKVLPFRKSVIPAQITRRRNVTNVLVHRLQDSEAFKDLDTRVCLDANLKSGCNPASAIRTLPQVKNLKQFANSFRYIPTIMFYCPSTRLVERMLKKNTEVTSSYGLNPRGRLAELWTTVHVTSAPLLLQMFPASESWPVPVYYGSCGRMYVVANEGQPLSDFLTAPWQQRARIALQLIHLADRLTKNDDEFALYMLHVTHQSFTVRGDSHVTLIDLDNILVVDQQAVRAARPENADDIYETPYEDCSKPSCHSFSEKQMCSHVISDHNYYVICHNILTRHEHEEGLLARVPEEVNNEWDLEYLLNECVMPSRKRGRLQIVHKLIEALTAIQNMSTS